MKYAYCITEGVGRLVGIYSHPQKARSAGNSYIDYRHCREQAHKDFEWKKTIAGWMCVTSRLVLFIRRQIINEREWERRTKVKGRN
jgi:hypothetical protein